MTVLVASTCASYKCDGVGEMAWLQHADLWRAAGHEFFCAVETGQGHDEWLAPLLARLDALDATVWRFSLDTGARTITTSERLVHICTGRNLAHEQVNRGSEFTHILFLDSDVEPPPDALERLLEVDHPLVGFHVPTYCLDGPPVGFIHTEKCGFGTYEITEHPDGFNHDPVPCTCRGRFPRYADVREHWNTAGALMVRRDAVRVLRWRWDLASGTTDDPAFQQDAIAAGLGQTWVRHDTVGKHWPECIGPVEHRGHDLSIVG